MIREENLEKADRKELKTRLKIANDFFPNTKIDFKTVNIKGLNEPKHLDIQIWVHQKIAGFNLLQEKSDCIKAVRAIIQQYRIDKFNSN